jgi:hypothetical protein
MDDNLTRTRREDTKAVIAILVMFLVFGTVAWRLSVAMEQMPSSADKLLVSLAAVTAAFITAVLSLIGILVKSAVDRRTEQRAEIESLHNRALQDDAEKRLTLEAAVSALELFSTATVSPAQRAGAIFMLSSLGQHELAIALLHQLLPSGDVPPEAAAEVLDRALRLGSEQVIRSAITVLLDHTLQFLDVKKNITLPYSLAYPQKSLHYYARDWAPVIIGKMFLLRSRDDWSRSMQKSAVLIGALAELWTSESDLRIKNEVAAILDRILKIFPNLTWVVRPSGKLNLQLIRAAIVVADDVSGQAAEVVAELDRWAGEAQPPAVPALTHQSNP